MDSYGRILENINNENYSPEYKYFYFDVNHLVSNMRETISYLGRKDQESLGKSEYNEDEL